MARTNDFTSRYLERRRELLGTGLSGRTNNQTDTGSSGSSRVTPASAELSLIHISEPTRH